MTQVRDSADNIEWCQAFLPGCLPGCGFCCWCECVTCGLPHHVPGLMGLSGFFFFLSDDGHKSFGIEDVSLLLVLERERDREREREREKGRLVAR